MSRIFINYRRQDTEGYVGRLYDHLTQYFEPEDIFMDVSSIDPGADFVRVLEDAVAACDVFLAMIGPHWLTLTDDSGARRLDQWNDFVRIEIASALKQGKIVIPVLVGRAGMPAPAALPDDLAPLARRNAVELSHQRFIYDVEQLITYIRSAVPANPSFKEEADSETVRQKAAALRQVRDELVNADDSPLYQTRIKNGYFPVLGAGNPDANILFIGESPGKNEAAQGEPFCGPSGDILEDMLQTVGLRREHVYITNVLLDCPADKRDPTPVELAYYTPLVDRIIDIIRPAVIVPLGRFAMKYILKKYGLPEYRGKISDLHGKLLKADTHYGQIHIVPMYHPAVILYTASKKELLMQDFLKLKMFV
jgi:uracil-DNA glycosylase family 4